MCEEAPPAVPMPWKLLVAGRDRACPSAPRIGWNRWQDRQAGGAGSSGRRGGRRVCWPDIFLPAPHTPGLHAAPHPPKKSLNLSGASTAARLCGGEG